MGKGSIKDDYSQLISFNDRITVPQESIAVIEEAHPKNEETIDISVGSINVSFNQAKGQNQKE